MRRRIQHRSHAAATDAQRSMLMKLAEQCFIKGVEVGYDMRAHVNGGRCSRTTASAEIQRLKSALANGAA